MIYVVFVVYSIDYGLRRLSKSLYFVFIHIYTIPNLYIIARHPPAVWMENFL